MDFFKVAVQDAVGDILAHTIKLDKKSLKKGSILTQSDCDYLKGCSVTDITVARLQDGDIHEDTAAAKVANSITNNFISVTSAFTGRCNLVSLGEGVFKVNRSVINCINNVHESVTLATLANNSRVEVGQTIATIKIIPFSVREHILNRILDILISHSTPINIDIFSPLSVGLINTTTLDLKRKIIDKTTQITRQRIEGLGGTVKVISECAHEELELKTALLSIMENRVDIIIITGSSVTVDRQDIVPSSIVKSGGEIVYFGMPVDPGNLVLLAEHSSTPILVLPGCARSPKMNGIDWILERLFSGCSIHNLEISQLGVGGLLVDVPFRPLPRAMAVSRKSESNYKIAAIVLAAGSSRRMGGCNKLLENISGVTLIRRTVEAILQARVSAVFVVTGHESNIIEKELSGLNIEIIHNDSYHKGLSTSIKAGVVKLADHFDGAIVCMGDMPLINHHHINRLVEGFAPLDGACIGVPVYKRKRGNPVLWARRFFSAMISLSGDVGARHLVGENSDLVYEVEFEDDSILLDLDTPADWAEFENIAKET